MNYTTIAVVMGITLSIMGNFWALFKSIIGKILSIIGRGLILQVSLLCWKLPPLCWHYTLKLCSIIINVILLSNQYGSLWLFEESKGYYIAIILWIIADSVVTWSQIVIKVFKGQLQIIILAWCTIIMNKNGNFVIDTYPHGQHSIKTVMFTYINLIEQSYSTIHFILTI